jgi:DNA-binding MarR family transcriptional regulator
MDLLRSPGFLISHLAHIMANHLERKLRKHGITVSQWAILKLLKTRDGMAQVELQQLLFLDGATVTGLVKRMTRHGFVRRETDPTDKRVQRVYLTEQGRQLESILLAEAESVNAHALQGFSEQETALLIDLLSRSLVNFQSDAFTSLSEGEH